MNDETTVWKFPLKRQPLQVVDIPGNAELLTVAMQTVGGWDTTFMLWARVRPASPTMPRRIAIVGTGQPAPLRSEAEYVATVFDGPFVWHVFDDGAA